MRFLQNISIKRKLTLIIMLTSSIVLLIVCVAVTAYELILYRASMGRDLTAQAMVTANNCTAALTFNNTRDATEALSALRGNTHILHACIYAKNDSVFTMYVRENEKGTPFTPPRPKEDGYFYADNRLALFQQITFDGERIGRLYIESDLGEMYLRLGRYAGIVLIVALASSLVAYILSENLQRMISEPILALARTTRVVSVEKDYSLRGVKHSEDEIGLLIEGFNEMLDQIQGRDASLQKAHDDLEMRVEERTRQLQHQVAERRRAEAEVRKLNEDLELRVVDRTAQLEAANRELESFSYSVSHDLRSPLRAINGFSSMLIEDHWDHLDPEAQRLLNVIRTNTMRMGQLIEDLLSFSRFGRKGLEQQKIDMHGLAESIVGELRAADPQRDVSVSVAPLAAAVGDGMMLRQVFVNLLSNAFKFTRYKPEAHVEVGSYVQNHESVYYVRDNGQGFDMQYAGKLFGVFQRLHSAEEFEGTGVGLAIVQRVVHRHGGRTWAEGEEGKGATFYFSLPRNAASNGASGEATVGAQPRNIERES